MPRPLLRLSARVAPAIVAALLTATAALAPNARAAAPSPPADQIVVKLRPGLTSTQRTDVRADADTTLEHKLALPGIEVLQPGDAGRTQTLADLDADPRVEWAAPNRTVTAFTEPLFSRQWALQNLGQSIDGIAGLADADIDAPEAWTVTKGAGVTVAVVDTGADLTHPDLVNQIAGTWVAAGLPDAQDANGHGTHVAGIIAAQENGDLVEGVAPEAKLKIMRALDAAGEGTDADIAAAFAYAASNGAKIVNASLGATGPIPATAAAIAAHPETLFVVAAGNDDVDVDGGSPTYPCAYAYANVLCVGASDQSDARAGFSNYGATSVDLFAPGTNIASDYLRSTGYDAVYLSGTSMATPQVAGTAALVLATHPAFTPTEVKAQLLNTADPLAAFAGLSVTGGRLNAVSAVTTTTDVTAPAAPTGLHGVAGDGSASLAWSPSASTDATAYRVYRRTVSGPWTLSATTPATSAAISGLPDDTYLLFAVAAVDAAGNESPRSAAIALMPTAPAPPPIAPATPAIPATTAPAARPSLGALHLVGRPRACTRRCGTPAALRFTLSAPSTVSVTAARRTCARGRCAYRTAARAILALTAGTQSVSVAPRLADAARLRAGAYRLTVRAGTRHRTLTVTVARR